MVSDVEMVSCQNRNKGTRHGRPASSNDEDAKQPLTTRLTQASAKQ